MLSNDPATAAISVSQLNRRVKTLIEQGMTRLWVEGEISNLSRPASGHIYLSLKDDSAQVSAAWFRQRQRIDTVFPAAQAADAHRHMESNQNFGKILLEWG